MPSTRLTAVRLRIAFVSLVCSAAIGSLRADDTKGARFPVLTNKDALSRIGHKEPQLPAWAKVLADPLPNTTVAMLKLDYLHRVHNPISKTLRAKIRWVSADAVGCDYSKATAIGDLQRNGVKKNDLKQFTQTGMGADADEQAAIAFTRKLTTAGHTVTDKEFEAVLKRFGAKQLVAMVHTVAHANFQDRIFLALGVQVESSGPVAPWQPPESKNSQLEAPSRSPWNNLKSSDVPKVERGPDDWQKLGFADLQKALKTQQKRNHRFKLLQEQAGAEEAKRAASSPILWNQVGMLYQPEMTRAWFECLNVFSSEGDLDRVLANSMFWVVTRSNECFY